MSKKSIVVAPVILSIISSFVFSYANAGTKDLSPELKEIMGIKDISSEKRKVVGTWLNRDTGCTRSFEESNGKYYSIARCKDGSGGKSGSQIEKKSSSLFQPIPKKSSGDHYIINTSGDLEIRDSQGLVDTLPKHSSLWP